MGSETSKNEEALSATPKRRGRPPKAKEPVLEEKKEEVVEATSDKTAEKTQIKRRTRTVKAVEREAEAGQDSLLLEPQEEEKPKRRRVVKAKDEDAVSEEKEVPKRRRVVKAKEETVEVESSLVVDEVSEPVVEVVAPKRRGRPPKAKSALENLQKAVAIFEKGADLNIPNFLNFLYIAFPKSFIEKQENRVPLKLDIEKDILDRLQSVDFCQAQYDFFKDNFKQIIHKYCDSIYYYKKLSDGVDRVNIDGNFASVVTDQERNDAFEKFKSWGVSGNNAPEESDEPAKVVELSTVASDPVVSPSEKTPSATSSEAEKIDAPAPLTRKKTSEERKREREEKWRIRQSLTPEERAARRQRVFEERKAAQERRDRENAEHERFLTFLSVAFPKAIFVDREQRVPLKIGIVNDILARLKSNPSLQSQYEFFDKARYKLMHNYCHSIPYLKKLSEGVPRIDLDGNFAGEIEEQHKQSALAQMEKIKREIIKAEKKKLVKNKKKRFGGKPIGKKRFGGKPGFNGNQRYQPRVVGGNSYQNSGSGYKNRFQQSGQGKFYQPNNNKFAYQGNSGYYSGGSGYQGGSNSYNRSPSTTYNSYNGYNSYNSADSYNSNRGFNSYSNPQENGEGGNKSAPKVVRRKTFTIKKN